MQGTSPSHDTRATPPPHPRSQAGLLGRLFFCWLFPIFSRGKNKDLQTKDLYQVLPENLSEPVTNKLESHWKTEFEDATERRSKPSLVKAIRKTFQWNFGVYGVHYFFSHLVLAVLQPVTIGQLISHFEEPSTSSSTAIACGYAGAFCLITLLYRLTFCHLLFGLRSIGISTRVACASLIYRKILKLSNSAKVTRGKIINMLSNDMSKIEVCFIFMHTLWMLPLQTILITYMIWTHVGVASIFGVLVLFLQTVPVQSYSGRLIASLRRKIAAKTDERVLLTGEIVRGIRVIKMYTWEKPFEHLMFLARKHEINIIAKTSYLKSTLWAVMAFAQRTPLFITVVIHVFQGNSMSAYTMFSLVQYFNIMHVTMGSYFLRAVNSLSEALASVKRVQDFLLLEEQQSTVDATDPSSVNEEAVVVLSGVSVASIDKPDVNFLHDINLSIRRNMLYAVVGTVGSGKSSLLKLILRELRPFSGQMNVHGELSYASQEPWLFKGTIRSNIVFAESYDKDRYDRVTRACALAEDFNQLTNGDQTIVEENGANLSGGQCARISLARAVYREADIYLLDDPLSAVDTRVGKHLLDECISGLLKDKTRILVTHQLQYLSQADEIILIDNGRVEYQGDFPNLQKNDELLQHVNLYETNSSPDDERSSTESLDSLDLENDEPGETEKLLKVPDKTDPGAKVAPLMTYWRYFTSGDSSALPYATLLAFACAQILCSSCDYFVAYWTKKQNSGNSTYIESSADHLDSATAVWIFGSLIVSIIVMSVIKMACYTTVCKKSNVKVHNAMTTSLLEATMRFFETNDSGKILNRFTKDLGTTDETLQAIMLEAVEYMFIIVGVATQIVIINHWFAAIIMLIAFLFWKSRTFVIKTTRSMMRLEGQAKSPVFSHANSSYSGRLTIRCCRAESLARNQFDLHQDNHTRAASLTHYSLVAYSFWLDFITWTFTIFLTYSFILHRDDKANGANVGLAITQVLVMTGILARGIKLTGDIETMIVAVERLFEYTNLESEVNGEIGQRPSGSWPDHGKIHFDNVSLRYSQDDQPVLKNLKFTIEAGEKIGIVGRSGAGKSSLTVALFRLAGIEGSIYIDDVDITKISLKQLRNKISILPQEPILFPVSLRKNLDPHDEHDDAILWSALQEVELNNVFASLDMTLDQHNLSTGQCQLLCLARAILKKNKILVLDEATANVDTNTDSLIQKTIRAKFKDCTVLTVAHRLNTVMDCDKIMVMSHGRIVEYDHPKDLLKKSDGYFSRLARQSNIPMS